MAAPPHRAGRSRFLASGAGAGRGRFLEREVGLPEVAEWARPPAGLIADDPLTRGQAPTSLLQHEHLSPLQAAVDLVRGPSGTMCSAAAGGVVRSQMSRREAAGSRRRRAAHQHRASVERIDDAAPHQAQNRFHCDRSPACCRTRGRGRCRRARPAPVSVGPLGGSRTRRATRMPVAVVIPYVVVAEPDDGGDFAGSSNAVCRRGVSPASRPWCTSSSPPLARR